MAANIQASRITAIAAGGWASVGFYIVEALQRNYASTEFAKDAIFIVAAVLLLLIPVSLFVAGPRYFSFGWRDMLRRSYWQEMRALAVRALWWLVGGVVGFGLVSLAELNYVV
jgi:hypothetical protein